MKGTSRELADAWELVDLHLSSGSETASTATVCLKHRTGRVVKEAAVGNGPVEAIFRAIGRASETALDLIDFQVKGLTSGLERRRGSHRRSRRAGPAPPRPRDGKRHHAGERRGVSASGESGRRHAGDAQGARGRIRTVTAKTPLTLFEKLWRRHLVVEGTEEHPPVVYIDLHLIHEVTSPQAFAELEARGLSVRRPDRTAATMDHSTPTTLDEAGRPRFFNRETEAQVETLRRNCEKFGIPLYALEDSRQGIVHVIGPELGLTRPGMTIVCGDSHTSTHGAFGAWAFGIGTTEVGHVLATQSLLQSKPKTFEVRVDGRLRPGVTAKDLILAIIQEIGVDGGIGHVIEYTGSAIRALSMEERMTVCNMSIEGGARAGLIAPDETTFAVPRREDRARPSAKDWERAVADWRTLPTDPGAAYDRTVSLDASRIEPMITYGTNPGMSVAIGESIPRDASEKSLRYMGLGAGEKLLGKAVDVVFIGSCTNSRISDLRLAASVMKGRHVAQGVRALVVPGSQEVKRQATAEGLDRIFREAGAEWREPGCSMCIAMNGDQLSPGELAVSTSNRNFEGRQGKGGRTILASPLTAAAAAVTGRITDARTLIEEGT